MGVCVTGYVSVGRRASASYCTLPEKVAMAVPSTDA